MNNGDCIYWRQKGNKEVSGNQKKRRELAILKGTRVHYIYSIRDKNETHHVKHELRGSEDVNNSLYKKVKKIGIGNIDGQMFINS